jgi:hypothetical protein
MNILKIENLVPKSLSAALFFHFTNRKENNTVLLMGHPFEKGET